MELLASPDGIHWRHRGQTGPTGDRTTMFYDAFRRKWVYSIRDEDVVFGRMRRYWQTDDFFAGVNWRALVLSITVTRRSRRSFHANWPRPTSTA